MKARYYFLMLALSLFAFAGCEKEKQQAVDLSVTVAGEWHCTPEAYDADIYVAFDTDGVFHLYQRVGEGRYRHYDGNWFVEKDVLRGVYSDGEEWGCTYKIAFDGDNLMVLTAMNDNAEAMTYVREVIPADVRNESIAPFVVQRSSCDEQSRWL